MYSIRKFFLFFIFIFSSASAIYSNSFKFEDLNGFEKRYNFSLSQNNFNNIIKFADSTKEKKEINYQHIFSTGIVLQSIAALITISFLPVLVMGIIKTIDFYNTMGYTPREIADELSYFIAFGIAIGLSISIQIPAVPLMVVGNSKTKK